jgi:hypothetical protein
MKSDTPQNENSAFLAGMRAALTWLESRSEYQDFKAAIAASDPRSVPPTPTVPNEKLTQYLFKLVEQRLTDVVDAPSEGYRRRVVEIWKKDVGDLPRTSLHRFAYGFVLIVHELVQQPIRLLVREACMETVLKTLWKTLNPQIARYRAWLQQLKNDPIMNNSPAMKDFVFPFCEGVLFVLNSCAPKLTEVAKARMKWGISKPIKSRPHTQAVFDKMLVDLVGYLRERIPDKKESLLFAHVSKILSLAWGSELCPDNPKLWQERFRRAK